jgi:O-acetyl-ADP-ribose deacetylase (regulator of RNase III)
MVIERKGNIFTTEAHVIVNPVNCVGVMGAGMAYEFRLREPHMYEKYRELCKSGALDIGKLWLYRGKERDVLNFPTKKHWRHPSKIAYIEAGLEKFMRTYRQKGITSIAFPLLGSDKGGLGVDEVLPLMRRYLEKADIPVEIWHFDPRAQDDLFYTFSEVVLRTPTDYLKERTGVRLNTLEHLREALENGRIRRMSELLNVKGVGEKSLEKLFVFAMRERNGDLFSFAEDV